MIVSAETEFPFDARVAGAAVIEQEAFGLSRLAEALDDSFVDAVRLIAGTAGRVIVTGMGKSGHVCRKIAATLSATGSSAFFVHAAEASHGDLGVLRAGDVVLALSNSGVTAELRPLINYARKLKVPIVALTSAATSWLARQATITVLLPAVPEACPQNIAPTTSSTMMLALGDALAIAAMGLRGVSRHQMVGWHPGGQIGRDAVPIATLIRPGEPLPLVTGDVGMRDVVIEMSSVGKGVAGVVDAAGDLVGIITDGDLRRSFDRMLTARAREIMTARPKTVLATSAIGDVRRLMAEAKITVVFVVDASNMRKPVAVVHLHDLSPAG